MDQNDNLHIAYIRDDHKATGVKNSEELIYVKVTRQPDGSSEDAAPKVFIGERYLAGLDNTLVALKDAVEQELASRAITWLPPYNEAIRVGLTTRGLVIGSITIGILVALLESFCTGQVYLPAIIFVTRAPSLRAEAISYLLLYNVMFILPLIVIFLVAYLGVQSQKLGLLLRDNLPIMKLAMAVLFAGLGMMVLLTV